jgi:hypothetical protein
MAPVINAFRHQRSVDSACLIARNLPKLWKFVQKCGGKEIAMKRGSPFVTCMLFSIQYFIKNPKIMETKNLLFIHPKFLGEF